MTNQVRVNKDESIPKIPPARSSNFFTDIKYFLINTPKACTLIKFKNEKEKHIYCERILQRTGIDVDNYRMLNIHRIGIETPTSYLFEELLKWNGNSTCWPNNIAKVNLEDNKLDNIQIFLFGRSKYLFGLKNGFFGLKLLHLFDLKAIKIKKLPDPVDLDNARYLLYECKGGYPIGIFLMYVRSSIPELGETEMSQLYFVVSFDFYGRKLTKINFISRFWETIHNRVTSNMLDRFKQLSEWQFDKFTQGKFY